MAKAWYINGPKRKKSRRKGKARRSKAQKRAFAKMIAGLRAHRGGGKKRRRKARKSATPRKRRKSHARKAHSKRRRTAAQHRATRALVALNRGGKRRRKHMARKVKHRRKHKRGHRRGRSRRITFKRVGHTNLWRRNPSGILGSAIGALKDGGPGAVGAAALNLWAVEPLMARFGVPRAAQPFVKIAAGLAQAALVDKFLPRWKKHSSAAAIGLMTLAANDLLSRLSGHPLGKLQDVADYYNGLNEIVDVPLGVLETGGVDAIYDNTPYGGNVEVMAH